MAVEFHAGMFSAKKARTLVEDIHWNAKKLMHQSDISYHLANKIKKDFAKLMDNKTKTEEKARIRAELDGLLKQLEQLSVLEEREEFLVARESAETQKKTLEDMKLHIRLELEKLISSHSIPKSVEGIVRTKVGEDFKKINEDIRKQAEIALEVKRGSASATLQTIRIMAPSEKASARRQKIKAYRAEHEFNVIKAIKARLMEDEESHEINKIKRDLIHEAHDSEKEIHYVYVNLLYCLLFMSYIEKKFKEIGKEIKNGERHPELKQLMGNFEKTIKRIQDEWYTYMTKLVRVLQHLRFSVAPAEQAEILSKAA